MPKKTYCVLPFISFLFTGLLFGQEIDVKSSRAKAAVREYDRKIKTEQRSKDRETVKLEKEFTKQLESANSELLDILKERVAEAAQKGDLEKATRLKNILDLIARTNLVAASEKPGNQRDATSPPVQPDGQATHPAKWPSHALAFQGHHYAFYDKQTTRHLASQFARSLGGHLVRVESTEEYKFVTETVNNKEKRRTFWLDGSDELQEGQWIFSNGEPVDFSVFKFTGGIPGMNTPPSFNESRGFHSLIFTRDGITNDRGQYRYYFIVEWDE